MSKSLNRKISSVTLLVFTLGLCWHSSHRSNRYLILTKVENSYDEEEMAQGVSIITEMFQQYVAKDPINQPKETRAFGPRCVKAESLDPEGSMIGYDMKIKNEQKNKKALEIRYFLKLLITP